MSAVSSESPLAAADLSAPSAHPSSQTQPGETAEPGTAPASADFGPNEWLVDELYERYLTDPGSVDKAWWSFFADYRPVRGAERHRAAAGADAQPAPTEAPPPRPPRARRAAGAPRPRPKASTGQRRRSQAPAAPPPADADVSKLRGAAARTAQNMAASLSVPTATSVRAVPAKLLIDNRIVINNHLQRGRGGKISFTHLIGYALVQAVKALPEMNAAYAEEDGKPVLATPHHVNLGLAIDLRAKDGSRQLLVPNIKGAEEMDFRQFWTAYEDVVRKARSGKLTVADFQGTTISLTNPGTIGTEHSVPRLMPGQGAIIGVGAMEYPAAYQGASEETMAKLAISKTVTLTSTYDHRIIQGAQSGDFLRVVHQLLLGENGFYDQHLREPAHPLRAGALGQGLPVRARGRRRPLGPGPGADPRLPGPRPPDGRHQPDRDRPAQARRPGHHPARPDAVGPGARVRDRRVRRQADHAAAGDPRRAARLLLPHRRHRVHAHPGPGRAQVDPGARRGPAGPGGPRRAGADPVQAQRGRGVRDVPADQVRRPEALLPGGRRGADPAARRGDQRGRRGRPRRGRGRHGAPRPAERARQRHRQVLRADLQGVRGQPRPEVHPGLRRREVPPGRARAPSPPRAASRSRSAWSPTPATWSASTR